LGVLPLRAALFGFAPGPWYLVAIQALDGLTAAAIGIMTPLVIADVTRGSGRYNPEQGVSGTETGIGAAASTVGTGHFVELFGYTIGFFALAVAGLIGVGIVYWLLPETTPEVGSSRPAL
jgi:MFS family permease